jgi:CoA:oxalate CoA-transferase
MAGPCDGLVVLDFSWGMAGGLATAVLADFGADVIKIEPPAGDPFRSRPAWLAWNRGKKSTVLDLKTAEGRGQVQLLAEQADVVIESFRPGVAHRLGIIMRRFRRSIRSWYMHRSADGANKVRLAKSPVTKA